MTLCIAAECEHDGNPAIAMVADWRGQTGDLSQPHGLIGSDDLNKLVEQGAATIMLAGIHSKAFELLLACKDSIQEFTNKAEKQPDSFDVVIDDFIKKLRAAGARKKIEIVEHYVPMRTGMSFADFKELDRSDHLDVWHDIRDLDLGADILISVVAPGPEPEPVIIRLDRWGGVHWESNYGVIGDGAEVARAFLCLQAWEHSGHGHAYHEVQRVPLKECIYRIYEAKQAAHIANPSSVGTTSAFQVLTSSTRGPIAEALYKCIHAAFERKHRVPKLEYTDGLVMNEQPLRK